jgi:hypothetical protein
VAFLSISRQMSRQDINYTVEGKRQLEQLRLRLAKY